MEHTRGMQLIDAYDKTFTITDIWTVRGEARYQLTHTSGFYAGKTMIVDYSDIQFLSLH